jgi:hypothetical protein
LPLCEPVCELLRDGAEDCGAPLPEWLGVYGCDDRDAVELFAPYG